MFMHIGNNQVIQTSDIIVMINQQDIEVSSINEEMIDYAEQEDDDLDYDEDVVKTIIFTNDGVYYSPLAIPTLKKRTSIKAILSQQESY
jgi:hypothetical protein